MKYNKRSTSPTEWWHLIITPWYILYVYLVWRRTKSVSLFFIRTVYPYRHKITLHLPISSLHPPYTTNRLFHGLYIQYLAPRMRVKFETCPRTNKLVISLISMHFMNFQLCRILCRVWFFLEIKIYIFSKSLSWP